MYIYIYIYIYIHTYIYIYIYRAEARAVNRVRVNPWCELYVMKDTDTHNETNHKTHARSFFSLRRSACGAPRLARLSLALCGVSCML